MSNSGAGSWPDTGSFRFSFRGARSGASFRRSGSRTSLGRGRRRLFMRGSSRAVFTCAGSRWSFGDAGSRRSLRRTRSRTLFTCAGRRRLFGRGGNRSRNRQSSCRRLGRHQHGGDLGKWHKYGRRRGCVGLHFVGQQSRRRLVRLQQQALSLNVQKLERPRRGVFEKARNRHQDHTIQEVSDLGRHGPPKNRCGASPRFYRAYGTSPNTDLIFNHLSMS